MKKLLIILLLICSFLSNAQTKYYWVGKTSFTSNGADPAILASNTATSANATTTPSLIGVPAGSLMVLTCASADDWNTATDVNITGTGLTWTKRSETSTNSGNYGTVEIWTAPCPSGGTVSASVAWQGGTTHASSSVLYSVSNPETTPSGNAANGVNQAAPSVAVATTKTNSIIFCVSSDWNAVAGTKTYRDGATNVLDHDLSPSTYRAYHYYKITTTVTTYTEGLTAPSTMSAGTAVYVIQRQGS